MPTMRQSNPEDRSAAWIEGIGTSVFVPSSYTPSYSYPVVVWLESSSGDGQEARDWFPRVSDRNVVVISLQPPLVGESEDQPLGTWRTRPDNVWEAMDYVEKSLAEVQDILSIHPERIFLAGREDGAAMAADLVCIHPHQFAGILAIDPAGPWADQSLADWRALPGKPAFHASISSEDPAWLAHLERLGMSVQHVTPVSKAELAAEIGRWILSSIPTAAGL